MSSGVDHLHQGMHAARPQCAFSPAAHAGCAEASPCCLLCGARSGRAAAERRQSRQPCLAARRARLSRVAGAAPAPRLTGARPGPWRQVSPLQWPPARMRHVLSRGFGGFVSDELLDAAARALDQGYEGSLSRCGAPGPCRQPRRACLPFPAIIFPPCLHVVKSCPGCSPCGSSRSPLGAATCRPACYARVTQARAPFSKLSAQVDRGGRSTSRCVQAWCGHVCEVASLRVLAAQADIDGGAGGGVQSRRARCRRRKSTRGTTHSAAAPRCGGLPSCSLLPYFGRRLQDFLLFSDVSSVTLVMMCSQQNRQALLAVAIECVVTHSEPVSLQRRRHALLALRAARLELLKLTSHCSFCLGFRLHTATKPTRCWLLQQLARRQWTTWTPSWRPSMLLRQSSRRSS